MNHGKGPGVRKEIAYETLSNELKELIGTLDDELELETNDIESIREQLRKVSEDAKRRSFKQS
jgi:hypothetical protein